MSPRRRVDGRRTGRREKARKGKMLSPVAASRGAMRNRSGVRLGARTWSAIATTRTVCRAAALSAQRLGDDLKMVRAEVTAQVDGIQSVPNHRSVREVARRTLAGDCTRLRRSIDTLVELLQGKLSTSVMERNHTAGNRPSPVTEGDCFQLQTVRIRAAMCKHVAATLYGIGARLDVNRNFCSACENVDAEELIARAGRADNGSKNANAGRILDSSKLADVFGIDFGGVDATPSHRPTAKKAKSVAPRKASRKPVGKRSARGKSGKAR